MKGIQKICNLAFFTVCTATSCVAAGFLSAQKFPTTIADAGFITNLESKADGYDRYASLSPYEQLILDMADNNIETQIAEDIAQSGEDVAEQNIEDTDENIEEQIAEDVSHYASGTEDGTSHTLGAASARGDYCKKQNPGIPESQKIPFGSPVLHEHFVYCSPYGNLDRGSGLRPHTGYDIGCTSESFNRPVFATADGVVKVIMPNRTGKSAGNYVIIQHDNGFETWYLHLNKILVKKGQRVSAGCQIATIGNTGGSLESVGRGDKNPHFRKSLSHLHYEIRYTGNKTSVRAGNGKTLQIRHGWARNTSIDPTQFICVYAHFKYGGCRV